MIRSKNFTLAITALALAGSASAWGPFGLSSPSGAGPKGTKHIGLTNLEGGKFPAFGNFSWEKDGVRFSSALGMAYRTHQHVVGQANGVKGKIQSGLEADKDLGWYREDATECKDERGCDYDEDKVWLNRHATLVSTVVSDVRDLKVGLDGHDSAEGLAELVHRRLTGKEHSGLSMALYSRSDSGQKRIHPVFVYEADQVKVDGQTYWECSFYDPTEQKVDYETRRGVGRQISRVYGQPSKAGATENSRFQKLRIPVNGSGKVQVSRNFGDVAFKVGDGDWAELEWDQVRTIDYHNSDGWLATLGDWAGSFFNGEFGRSISMSRTNITPGGAKSLVEDPSFQFGTFDTEDEVLPNKAD
jgi:hypothetical protein